MPCPPVGPSGQARGVARLVGVLEALHLHLGGLRERERESESERAQREDGVIHSQQKNTQELMVSVTLTMVK